MLDRAHARFWLMVTFAIICPSHGAAQEMSAEDLVSRCAQAMGRSKEIEALRTLTFESVSWSMGPDHPTTWEILLPGRFRFERAGEYMALFDGGRFGFLEGPREEDGTLPGPHLLPAENWPTFQMDTSPHIPGFFDHPSQYLGTTLVDGEEVHLLRVEYSLGGIAVYNIDAESFLPMAIDYPELDFRILLSDFREVGGVLFAHKQTNAANPERVTSFRNFAVNVELDPARFVFPADIR